MLMYSAVLIGRINIPLSQLIENVISGLKGVVGKVPRGWANIQSVHLKTTESIALPIYNSLPPQPTTLPGVNETALPTVTRLTPPIPETDVHTPHSAQIAGKSKASLSAKRVRGSTIKSEKSVKKARRKTLN